MAEQRLNSLADRLEQVAVRLESISTKSGSGGTGANGETYYYSTYIIS